MAIKIRSTTSFGGVAKPSAPSRKILIRVKERYEYEKRYFVGKIHVHFRQVFTALTLGVSAGYYPRSLVDESGMIRLQMGTRSRSEMVAV
jgi:hypothetical protein